MSFLMAKAWAGADMSIKSGYIKFSPLTSKEELRLLALPGLQKPLEASINPVKLAICSFCEKSIRT